MTDDSDFCFYSSFKLQYVGQRSPILLMVLDYSEKDAL